MFIIFLLMHLFSFFYIFIYLIIIFWNVIFKTHSAMYIFIYKFIVIKFLSLIIYIKFIYKNFFISQGYMYNIRIFDLIITLYYFFFYIKNCIKELSKNYLKIKNWLNHIKQFNYLAAFKRIKMIPMHFYVLFFLFCFIFKYRKKFVTW